MLSPAAAFGCDEKHRPAPIEDILLVARDLRSIHGVGERDHGGVESRLVVEPQFGNHVEVRPPRPCREDRAFGVQIVAPVVAYLRRDRQDEWRVAILVVVDEVLLTEPGFAGQHRDYLDGHGFNSASLSPFRNRACCVGDPPPAFTARTRLDPSVTDLDRGYAQATS